MLLPAISQDERVLLMEDTTGALKLAFEGKLHTLVVCPDKLTPAGLTALSFLQLQRPELKLVAWHEGSLRPLGPFPGVAYGNA